jgi:hypothetical protein
MTAMRATEEDDVGLGLLDVKRFQFLQHCLASVVTEAKADKGG